MNEPLYAPKQVQQILGVSGTALRKMCERGLVDPMRDANGTRYYTQAELDRLIEYRARRIRACIECPDCE